MYIINQNSLTLFMSFFFLQKYFFFIRIFFKIKIIINFY